MRPRPMRPRPRRPTLRAALAAPLLAGLHGCTTWHGRPTSDAASLAAAGVSEQHPVRLTLRDGRVLTLTTLVVSGDSVIGLRGDPRRSDARVVVALADVRAVEERRVDARKTEGLVAGVLGVAAALLLALVYLVASVST